MSHSENMLFKLLFLFLQEIWNAVSNKRIYVRRQEQLFNYRDSAFVLGGLKAFNFFAFFCFVALAPDWKAFQLSTLDCRDSSKFFCHSRSNAACASAESSSSRFLLRCSASLVANSLLHDKKRKKRTNSISYKEWNQFCKLSLLCKLTFFFPCQQRVSSS